MKTQINKNSIWYKLGCKIFDYRIGVFSILLVISLVFTFFAKDLSGKLGGDGFKTSGDYIKTQELLESEFDQSPNSVIMIVEKKKNTTNKDFTNELQNLVDTVTKEKKMKQFMHPFINETMKKDDVAYLTFTYDEKDFDRITELNNKLGKKVSKLSNDKVKITSTGLTFISDEMNKKSMSDLKKAELIGVPIAFIILFFAFGSLVASLIPIIIGGLTILTSFGILSFVADKMELSVFVLNVAPMIGLALSIDFALLYINRYREEIKTKTVKEALATSFATAGRAIIFSGLCVFIGLSALAIIDIELFQSVAISGATVVAIAILFSLTILPAVIGILGNKLFKGSIPFVQKRIDNSSQTMWRKFADFVMKRPAITAFVAVVVLIICILPIRYVNLDIPTFDVLPKSSESRYAYEVYEKEFQSDLKDHASALVVVQSKRDFSEEGQLQEAENFLNTLSKDKNVDSVISFFNTGNITAKEAEIMLSKPETAMNIEPVLKTFVQGKTMIANVYLKAEPKASVAKEWARNASEKYSNPTENLSVTIGGQIKFEQELYDAIWNKIGIGLTIILVSTFIILMFAFKSLLIPLKAILMNILSLSATFGIITWLFQNGHFGLPETYIMLILPVFIFGLVFGLSMDYEVFLISRIQEIYHETSDNDLATKEGLVSTSTIITSAASIMIVVTGAFAFTDLVPIKQMGIGIAIAIFLDATIIRLLLVPSLMKLLGDWNWWLPFTKNKRKVKKGVS